MGWLVTFWRTKSIRFVQFWCTSVWVLLIERVLLSFTCASAVVGVMQEPIKGILHFCHKAGAESHRTLSLKNGKEESSQCSLWIHVFKRIPGS